MDDTAGMGVVVIETVDQDAVDECGVAHRQPRRESDDLRVAFAREATHRGQGPVCEIEAGRGERYPNGIQHQMLRPGCDSGRDLLEAEPGRETAEGLADEWR